MTEFGKREVIVQRRARVGELHLKGFSAADIAGELGVCRRTVERDLKLAIEGWRVARGDAVERARVVELATLRLLEREAWEGWLRSQDQGVSEKLSKTEQEKPGRSARAAGDGERGGEQRGIIAAAKKLAERTTRSQYGDPRFLMLIMRCVERRARLLGAESPSEGFMMGARLTVGEVLDQMSGDPDFLEFCRQRAAQQWAEPPRIEE
jgi:hypothetical protein